MVYSVLPGGCLLIFCLDVLSTTENYCVVATFPLHMCKYFLIYLSSLMLGTYITVKPSHWIDHFIIIYFLLFPHPAECLTCLSTLACMYLFSFKHWHNEYVCCFKQIGLIPRNRIARSQGHECFKF